MSVITIRGEMGSGAPEIGKLLAKALGSDYVDRQIIAEVADQLKWSKLGIEQKETPPTGFLGRIGEALALAYPMGTGFSGAYLPTTELPLQDGRYLAGLESVIKELAKNPSIVIRGRGSQFILKDLPGAFHVLLVAPLDIRIKRIKETSSLTDEDARKEIDRFDDSHKEFAKRYFHAELEDPGYYDLVINTRHLSLDTAASLVVAACKAAT